MRYKQTVIGVAWAFVRPFLTMVVFTVVFGQLAKLPSDGSAPYAVMVFAGLLPWTLFASVLSEASSSVVGNANLISKVYFPRLIMPLSTVVVALIDFAGQPRDPGRPDDLVRLGAGLADPAAAGLRRCWPCWRRSARRSGRRR